MKPSLLAIASVLVLASPLSAKAADMAVKAPPPPAATPAYSWTGFYIGGAAGGAWAKDQITDANGLNAVQTYTLDSDGFIGSGVVGFNYQAGPAVFGIEADLGRMNIGKTISEPNSGTPPVTSNRLASGDYDDVTGRAGFAFDRVLVYAKGGWAHYDGRANVNNTLGGFGGGIVYTNSFTGSVIGGGVEYAFLPNWSAKIEYAHFNFGTQTALLITPFNGNFAFPNTLTVNAITGGVNYHFNFGH